MVLEIAAGPLEDANQSYIQLLGDRPNNMEMSEWGKGTSFLLEAEDETQQMQKDFFLAHSRLSESKGRLEGVQKKIIQKLKSLFSQEISELENPDLIAKFVPRDINSISFISLDHFVDLLFSLSLVFSLLFSSWRSF